MADFDATAARAHGERMNFHEKEVFDTMTRFNAEIAAAKAAKDSAMAKTLAAEQRDYEKRKKAQIAAEARALLKERLAYPIFLYEAEKVGITATGEPDANELTPNDRVPAGLDKTCLEVYQAFRANPSAFMLSEASA